ncbi:Uncharacterized conserved protein, DUF58 family, contains vWF domain [Clostridium cavendishii DSM 21758]|uniref:Uncharacterized conserved protein, DUF58 family, contains vWF domain n=1 Tax=Clostridium cavendishii DSM 21758 TaxID=1121302 RepID=A0A1M6MPC2_9CLOT|nr:DUF58 domain-containing protein [Clostridium cavendishii]SHJ85307.1 Uncharacterized conserved protein, DUF58 family, contains vWF domain [Clostridium cavendishii DSM 21758]
MMDNRKIRYLIFLIITVVIVYIQGEQIGYMLICIAILPLLYSFISFINSKNLISIINLNNRYRYVCGEDENFDFIIKNRGILIIPFLEIYNSSITKLNSTYKGEIITLAPREEVLITNNIHFNKRGVYNIGEFSYIAKDIFGLLGFRGRNSDEFNIKVYPKIYNLSYEIISGQNILKNNGTNKLIEDNYTIKEMRRYRSGDPLKKINWKVSAKRRDLYVKEDDKTSGKELAIFLDMSKENYKLYNNNSFEETLVDFSVSLVNTFIKNNTSCTMFVNNRETMKFEVDNGLEFKSLIEYMVYNDSIGDLSIAELIHSSKEIMKEFNGVYLIINQLDYKIYESIFDIIKRGFIINVFYITFNIDKEKMFKLKENGVILCNIRRCLDGGELEDEF